MVTATDEGAPGDTGVDSDLRPTLTRRGTASTTWSAFAPTSRALVVVVLLVAFALRIGRLEHHDIWGDEALSVRISAMDLSEIPVAGASVHPPGYYALLYGWVRLVGTAPYALRTISVLLGALTVAVIFALGRRTVGDRAALIGAFIAAVAPFQVYYAQEARMYALIAFLAALMLYTFLDVVAAPGRARSWLLFLLPTVAATYTHYYAFFLLAALTAYLVYRWWSERRRLARWFVAMLAVGVAYIPWIVIQSSLLAGQAHSRVSELSAEGLWRIVGPTLTALAAGTTMGETYAPWVTLAATALAALGLASMLAFTSSRRMGSFLALVLVVPVVLAWLTTPLMPFFFPRFLILISPAFYLLVARGTTAIGDRSRLTSYVVLGLVVVGSAYSLNGYYYDRAYWKGGYGRLMAYIDEHSLPGDAIVTINPDQRAIYDYYAPESIPRYQFPMTFPLEDPRSHEALTKMADEHPRVWLILYGDATPYDPDQVVARWLGLHGARSYHGDYVDAGLDLYVMGDGRSGVETPVGAVFDGRIELVGYRLEPAVVSPGESLRLSLHWRSLDSIDRPYTVFTHLIDESHTIWSQMDGEPVGGTHPTTAWLPGEEIWDNFGLELTPNTPKGNYCLEIGWYYLETMERLGVEADGRPDEDHVVLCPVEVAGQ